MLTVEEALAIVLASAPEPRGEVVALDDTLGRVLADDVVADIDNPPFDNSAVDGYAVRAVDTVGASADCPVRLRELGEVPAGAPVGPEVLAGTCVRVMTGGAMPPGADAMVMVEHTERHAGDPPEVEIRRAAAVDAHVRFRGEDVRAGGRVLARGTPVGPAEVAMLAAMGASMPRCFRRPRVAVASTGNELVDVSERPGPGQVRDCNRPALAALVREAGALVAGSARLPDSPEATERALRAWSVDAAEPVDLILTSGGVSVGDHDYVKPAVERIGTLDLWRVAMKPGKPVAFGRLGATLFVGLPGNPVATLVTFEIFVRPLLGRMAGRQETRRLAVSGELTAPIRHRAGRREFVRAAVRVSGERVMVTATGAQSSGMLTSMQGANALVVVPEAGEDLPAGAVVTVLLLGTSVPGAA